MNKFIVLSRPTGLYAYGFRVADGELDYEEFDSLEEASARYEFLVSRSDDEFEFIELLQSIKCAGST